MSVADAAVAALPRVTRTRVQQFLTYCAVGASGVVVDTATVAASTTVGLHYLVATLAAFLTANAWNFLLNRRVTFNATDGRMLRQWLGYLGTHAGSLGIRMGVVAILVETAAVGILPATLAGIGAAALFGYRVSEVVFNP